MDAAGREAWTCEAVHAAVARIVGSPVGNEEPLLRAGVDSLGALSTHTRWSAVEALRC